MKKFRMAISSRLSAMIHRRNEIGFEWRLHVCERNDPKAYARLSRYWRTTAVLVWLHDRIAPTSPWAYLSGLSPTSLAELKHFNDYGGSFDPALDKAIARTIRAQDNA